MLGNVAYIGLDVGQDLDVCVPVNGGFLGSLVAVDRHTHLTDTTMCHEASPDEGCDVGLILGDGVALICCVSLCDREGEVGGVKEGKENNIPCG